MFSLSLSLPHALIVLLSLSTSHVSASALPQQPASLGASQEYTSTSSFRDAVLNVTNTYRKQHNASALAWNDTLVKYAEKWVGECGFEHSGGPYGENLASGYGNASAAVVAWGEEGKKYDFKKADFSSETGHFTQLVWKNTTQVGCARNECNAGQQGGEGNAPGWYVVCEYSPSGNVLGQFKDNVQAQVGGQNSANALRGSMGALWVGVVVAVGVGWL